MTDRLPGHGRNKRSLFRFLGPGRVAGAADDDPSGIATYAPAGAQCGDGLLWTVILTFPFMIAVQLISARIGQVTGTASQPTSSRRCPGCAHRAIAQAVFERISIGAWQWHCSIVQGLLSWKDASYCVGRIRA